MSTPSEVNYFSYVNTQLQEYKRNKLLSSQSSNNWQQSTTCFTSIPGLERTKLESIYWSNSYLNEYKLPHFHWGHSNSLRNVFVLNEEPTVRHKGTPCMDWSQRAVYCALSAAMTQLLFFKLRHRILRCGNVCHFGSSFKLFLFRNGLLST